MAPKKSLSFIELVLSSESQPNANVLTLKIFWNISFLKRFLFKCIASLHWIIITVITEPFLVVRNVAVWYYAIYITMIDELFTTIYSILCSPENRQNKFSKQFNRTTFNSFHQNWSNIILIFAHQSIDVVWSDKWFEGIIIFSAIHFILRIDLFKFWGILLTISLV